MSSQNEDASFGPGSEGYVPLPPGTTAKDLADAFAAAETSGLPPAVWPGMTLKWDSTFTEIQLQVELPFWLLMPDAQMLVSHEGCTLRVAIENDGIEIQHNRAFRDSHINTVYLGKMEHPLSERVVAILKANENGVVLRRTRTLVTLFTRGLEDCTAAINETGRRKVDATMYFRSLALAHFPHINRIINAYRKSSLDPFAMEITEWDVPVWFACIGDKLTRLCLMSYADSDEFPNKVSIRGGDSTPIHFATSQEVQSELNLGEEPGDAEILDAWALYYRGRFGDAIRSLVTGIEVVLEYSLERALTAKGLHEQAIEARLQRTFNDFDERLADYLEVTGRRMPPPMISAIPYINGIRLEKELAYTRNLRHKVVHEGLRLDRSLKDYMQRPMETMSWLINWFKQNSAINPTSLKKNYILKQAMISAFAFLPHEYTPEGVVIKAFESIPKSIPNNSDLLGRQFLEALDKDTADLEKFTLMSFSRLELKIIDTAIPTATPPFLYERFIVSDNDKRILVFLIDTGELVNQAVVEQVATRVQALQYEGKSYSSVLCIINHQNGLSWQLREVAKAITSEVALLAAACGITLITAVDLFLFINGIQQGYWKEGEVRSMLWIPGYNGDVPPGCQRVGTLKHFYNRDQVLSIELDASANLRLQDTLVARLQDRYYTQKVESMQLNGTSINEANENQRIGIKTTLHRNDISLGTVIYRRMSP